MPTTITWNDGSPGTLSNAKPVPADRFSNWNPSTRIFGDEEESLGTGTLYVFPFRTDYLVTFELRQIPRTSMDQMLRLEKHLRNGGTVSVNTGDTSTRVYATCCLQKGADPSPKLSDPKNLEYAMVFALRNIAGSPVDFICTY